MLYTYFFLREYSSICAIASIIEVLDEELVEVKHRWSLISRTEPPLSCEDSHPKIIHFSDGARDKYFKK